MPIGEFCNREVVIADPATPVTEAARLMRQHHVGCLVVVESMTASRRPVGVITDRDLVVEVLAKTDTPGNLSLGDLLTAEAATVRSEVGVFETLRYMRERGHRRMPVVDDAGLLVGIVALDDYIALLAEEMTELAQLMDVELQREGQLRGQ